MSPTRRDFVKLMLATPVASAFTLPERPVVAAPVPDITSAMLFLTYDGHTRDFSCRLALDDAGALSLITVVAGRTFALADADERVTPAELFQRVLDVAEQPKVKAEQYPARPPDEAIVCVVCHGDGGPRCPLCHGTGETTIRAARRYAGIA